MTDDHANKINPKKLMHSKWTAAKPVNKEKHFMVTQVIFDHHGDASQCLIEAVISGRTQLIAWVELNNAAKWHQGWR